MQESNGKEASCLEEPSCSSRCLEDEDCLVEGLEDGMLKRHLAHYGHMLVNPAR